MINHKSQKNKKAFLLIWQRNDYCSLKQLCVCETFTSFPLRLYKVSVLDMRHRNTRYVRHNAPSNSITAILSVTTGSYCIFPHQRAHCPAWWLARSLLYEWMGVALVTSNGAVVTALVDMRWRSVGGGCCGVKLGSATAWERQRGKERGERQRQRHQPTSPARTNF